jgi:hypothetical protein
MLPEKICRCEHVSEFLRPRPQDLREEYPPVEKITNLYGQPLLSLLTALSILQIWQSIRNGTCVCVVTEFLSPSQTFWSPERRGCGTTQTP